MFTTAIRVCLPIMFLAAGAFAQSDNAAVATCTFRPVQIKKDYTFVYGINNKNAVVGTYNPTISSQAGFVWQGNIITTIMWPGMAYTGAYGMSDTGTVVGAYAKDLRSANQGFVWVNGKFTNLTYPGALATYANGVNIRGKIAGSYQDSAGTFHGFIYSGGKYLAINYPKAASTLVSGINNNGALAGSYTDSSNLEHGFVYVNGKFTTVNYPGAANTALGTINDNNVVTGTYYNASYSQYAGFVWNKGKFRNIIDPADPHHTAANGLNNSLVLVGNRDDSGVGFKATGCAQ